MKKRGMTLFALFALVAITSYLVSGTYAKYTYHFTDSDSARVARWGISDKNKIHVDLFKDSYLNGAVTDVQAYNKTDSTTGDKIVAPGTSGIYEFMLDLGDITPETNYKIEITNNKTATADNDVVTDDNVGRIVYYLYEVDKNTPVTEADVFANGTPYSNEGSGATLKKGIDKLVDAISNNFNKTYKANTNPSSSKKYVIGWKWEFSESDDLDTADNSLGNAGLSADGTSFDFNKQAKVQLSLNVKFEQSEDAPTA